MRRPSCLLMIAVAVQSTILAWLLWGRPSGPVPPLPNLSLIDSITASELRQLRDECGSSDDYMSLGSRYFAYGFFPEAAVCHEIACELAPSDARARFEWAFCLSHSGRYDESNKRYYEAIELGSERADCLYFIGQNYLRLDKLEEAKLAFTQAGDLPVARYELQKTAMRESDSPEVLGEVDKELADMRKKYPQSTDTYYLSARLARRMGRLDEASRLLDLADRTTGRLPGPFDIESERLLDVHAEIGLSRQRNSSRRVLESDSEEDENALKDAIQVRWNADDVDVLAELALRRGRMPEAIQLLNQIVDRGGPDMGSLWRLGDGYAMNNQPQEAEKAWLTAIDLGRGNYGDLADLHKGVSQFCASLNRPNEADLQQAEGVKSAGVKALQVGQFDAATKQLRRSTELAPDAPQTWFYLAESLRLQGKQAEAAAAYRRCLTLAPHHGRAIEGAKLNDSSPR